MALYAPCCGLAAHRPQVSQSIRLKARGAALTPLPAERTCSTRRGWPGPRGFNSPPVRAPSIRSSIGRRSMEAPFYKTRMGQCYYEHTAPELVRQLARLK